MARRWMNRMVLGPAVLCGISCQPMTHQDPADLTPLARAMEGLVPDGELWTAREIPALGGPPMPDVFEAPQTVQMWLRSEGSETSCSGTVVEVELEEYIRHVIPHEWYASWHEESLMSGATAARSYAAWWVTAGGKYDCADVCDTSYTQNYGETTDGRTDAAILATQSTFIMDAGDVVFAEYSAENGDPTEYGVSEPHCTGEARYGHGRGLCQWGSQRWANDGKDHAWMADHYYLGATLLGPLEADRLDDVYRLVMESGEVRTIELSWENQGSTRWHDGQLHLEAAAPEGRQSAFSATWETPSRAATLEGDVAPGDVGFLELTLVAPEVEETARYDEQLGLYSSDLDAWVAGDGAFELTIEVYPEGDAPEMDTGRRDPAELPDLKDDEAAAGCGCAGTTGAPAWGLLVALVALLRRREAYSPPPNSR